MKVLLSIIAVCLIMITAKLYLPEASAEVGGMDYYELSNDYDFREAVKSTINEECRVAKKGSARKYWFTINC